MDRDSSVLDSVRMRRQIEIAWKAGPRDSITVNSDGSVQGIRGKAAAGGILRDNAGNCLQAYAMNIGSCSITRAEIRGAIGIRKAWDAGYRKVEVQMDSQAAIYILTNDNPRVAHQHSLEVLEVQELLHRDWEVTFKHVYREANHAAGFLANCGHSLPQGTHSIGLDNCNLSYYIRYDGMRISEPKLIN
ncbi:Putative ribonuclease H protein At1g65750 [Linum perenne]